VNRFYLVAAFAALVSCRKSSASQPPATGSGSAQDIVAPTEQQLGSDGAAVAALHKANGQLVPTTDTRQLVGDLQNEAMHRPKAGVLAEPLFDALDQKATIHLGQRQQYAGFTMKASFCAGGTTTDSAPADRLTVSMCEYSDDKAAKASLDFMNSRFPIKNARREEHHAAVLTIVALNATDARVDQAFKIFESL
jgi:hypothetical protein